MESFEGKFEVIELATLGSGEFLCHGALFNQSAFFRLHGDTQSEADLYLVLRERKKGTVVATFWCSDVGNGAFRSPKRGSFGGVEALQSLSFLALEGFVDAIIATVRIRGGTSVEMLLPPLAYTPPASSLLMNVLLRRGFSLSGHELNYSIPVDRAVAFRSLVDAKNRNKMNKCVKSGFSCRTLETLDDYAAAYRVIELNRAKKNIPLTMPWEALRQMHEAIPNTVHCFACYSREEMIASGICMRVSSEVFYVFYWGEVEGVESFSPVSFLAEHIYDYCIENEYKCLDAGTATVMGVPNVGLASYKKKLGFEESLKLSLTKPL